MLLTGAPREPRAASTVADDDNPGYNSLLAIDTDGEIVASYDKSHLVPFGEYLPFAELLAAVRHQTVRARHRWLGAGRRQAA